jgi:repressor LexA
MASRYTAKEGQYLAFIYYYAKIHHVAPSEADMRAYFRATPPAVHNMIVRLDTKGLIDRQPRTPRSIRLLLRREELPDLE